MLKALWWKTAKKILAGTQYDKLISKAYFKKYASKFDYLYDSNPNDVFLKELTPFIDLCQQTEYYQTQEYSNLFNFTDPKCIFNNLPIMDKTTLIKHFNDLININIPIFEQGIVHTSGSTGEPAIISRSIFSSLYSEYLFYRSICDFLNIKIYSPKIALINLLNKFIGKHYGEGNLNYYKLSRPEYGNGELLTFNFLDDDKERILEIYQCLKEMNIDIISSTPEVFSLFISELKKQNIKANLKNLKLSVSSGSNLTQQTRETISDFFNVKVMNVYALQEGGFIGAECPQNRAFHIYNRLNHYEIQNINNSTIGKFGTGNLILTPIHNLATPLIRYNTKDILTLDNDHSCTCGKKGLIIESLNGRATNFFTTLKGNKFNPALEPKLITNKGIKQIQFIQESKDLIIINYTPISNDEIDFKNFEESFYRLMEGKIEIKYKKMQEITPAHKKHIPAISKINS